MPVGLGESGVRHYGKGAHLVHQHVCHAQQVGVAGQAPEQDTCEGTGARAAPHHHYYAAVRAPKESTPHAPALSLTQRAACCACEARREGRRGQCGAAHLWCRR